ncbi:MAG: hypothetical protein IJL98_03390 [Lachnospiraceae bacterium]|nr:hypothetical protein [Lachnospiraceae bacterium]
MRQKINAFIDGKGPWIIGIGGLILTGVCAWFQTMNFTYVSFGSCLTAVIIGMIIAYGVTAYLYRKTKDDPENPQKVLRKEVFGRYIRSIAVMFFVVGAFTFLATTEPAFLVGLAGMAFGAGTVLFYIFFRALMNRRPAE